MSNLVKGAKVKITDPHKLAGEIATVEEYHDDLEMYRLLLDRPVNIPLDSQGPGETVLVHWRWLEPYGSLPLKQRLPAYVHPLLDSWAKGLKL